MPLLLYSCHSKIYNVSIANLCYQHMPRPSSEHSPIMNHAPCRQSALVSASTATAPYHANMDYDKFLEFVGQFGRYQKFIYFFGCLFHIGACFDNMSYVFLSLLPKYWCEIPGTGDLNLTENQRKDLSFPVQAVDGKTAHRLVFWCFPLCFHKLLRMQLYILSQGIPCFWLQDM